jgi:hypothetical protein
MARSVKKGGKAGQGKGVVGGVGGDEPDQLIENGQIADRLGHALSNGESGMKCVPGLLKRCIRMGCWRERKIECLAFELVQFDRFIDFVAAPIPRGLGADLRTLKNLCRDDPEALDAIDRETEGKHGGDRSKSDNGRLDDATSHRGGNTKDYALRRLRKDRPELHAKVLSGDLSAHAAMLQAGFRRVPSLLDTVKRQWRKASAAERAEIRAWLDAQ